MSVDLSTYFATRCRNAEPGTYGHECAAPAVFLGRGEDGRDRPYCLRCRAEGTEARRCVAWSPAEVWTVHHPIAGCMKQDGFWTTLERNAGAWRTRAEAETAAAACQELHVAERARISVWLTNPALDFTTSTR